MKRLAKLFLWIIKLRYTVQITWLPKKAKNQTFLILPNHISFLEPMLVWSIFRPYAKIRPVVTSIFTQNRILAPIFRLIGAISVEENPSNQKKDFSESINSSLSELKNALKKSDSVLLFPSGQLAGQGLEYLWGKKSALLAVNAAPENTKILTVRIQGLWWSMRSKARTGESPNLFRSFAKAVRYLLANLIFFLPKRKITIEIVEQTDFLKEQATTSLEAFNHNLENFYNKKGEEKLRFLPHYFYYNDVKNRALPDFIQDSIKSLKTTKTYNTQNFNPEIIETIFSELKTLKQIPTETTLSLEQNLILDLYLDSLDMAEIKNIILAKYPSASNTPVLELKTVADLVAMAMGLTQSEASDFKPCDWKISSKKQERLLDEKLNILEHFKLQRKTDKQATQIYDQIFGLQTRSDMVLKSLLISDYLRTIPWKHIWIMLPSLGSTSILLLSTYLAEKIPVMMNRTHPQGAFDHCVKFSKTQKILTSKKFFDKINISRLKDYDFIFLEDLLKNISVFRKIKALIKSKFFPLPKKLDPTAVVLYTSGSENLPKAVELTHKNLITNLQGALDIMHIKHDERLFCYLPPFHSFGFTVNTVLPLVAGLRSINTPDPNDSLTVAKLIDHTKPTLLATTPTFLRNLLHIASPDQLTSLRYVITGGEKCSEAVFEKFKKSVPHWVILEGYWITECSPIIAINPIEKQKAQSVGISIWTGKIKIVNIDTNQEMNSNQEWMILFSAPSVFNGYLDSSIESPFLEIDWERWYKTWDLGYLDKNGYLYITGRKKRFLKLWWEMISLPFIESLLLEKYGSDAWANLAVEWKETEDNVEITLFCVDFTPSLKEVNLYLKSKWVNNLIKIDHIKPIWELPLLGSGKIDYKILKSMC